MAEKYNRKAKSLGLLCENFINAYGNGSVDVISLDDASERLDVPRRRLYDIVNVLESIQIVSRQQKNRYIWRGMEGIPAAVKRLRSTAFTSAASGASSYATDFDEDEEENESDANAAALKRERGEKSLGMLSKRFVQMFLTGGPDEDVIVTLDAASKFLEDEYETDPAKHKTKVRRLYDIANILISLQVIEKTQSPDGRKPAFRWCYGGGRKPGQDGALETPLLKPRLTERDTNSTPLVDTRNTHGRGAPRGQAWRSPFAGLSQEPLPSQQMIEMSRDGLQHMLPAPVVPKRQRSSIAMGRSLRPRHFTAQPPEREVSRSPSRTFEPLLQRAISRRPSGQSDGWDAGHPFLREEGMEEETHAAPQLLLDYPSQQEPSSSQPDVSWGGPAPASTGEFLRAMHSASLQNDNPGPQMSMEQYPPVPVNLQDMLQKALSMASKQALPGPMQMETANTIRALLFHYSQFLQHLTHLGSSAASPASSHLLSRLPTYDDVSSMFSDDVPKWQQRQQHDHVYPTAAMNPLCSMAGYSSLALSASEMSRPFDTGRLEQLHTLAALLGVGNPNDRMLPAQGGPQAIPLGTTTEPPGRLSCRPSMDQLNSHQHGM